MPTPGAISPCNRHGETLESLKESSLRQVTVYLVSLRASGRRRPVLPRRAMRRSTCAGWRQLKMSIGFPTTSFHISSLRVNHFFHHFVISFQASCLFFRVFGPHGRPGAPGPLRRSAGPLVFVCPKLRTGPTAASSPLSQLIWTVVRSSNECKAEWLCGRSARPVRNSALRP